MEIVGCEVDEAGNLLSFSLWVIQNFICVFELIEIEEKIGEDDVYLNYKIGITDCENSGYIFRYADDMDEELTNNK